MVKSGDTAVTYGAWTLTGTSPDGPIEMSGKGVAVLRRQPDGNWLYVVDDPWADQSWEADS